MMYIIRNVVEFINILISLYLGLFKLVTDTARERLMRFYLTEI